MEYELSLKKVDADSVRIGAGMGYTTHTALTQPQVHCHKIRRRSNFPITGQLAGGICVRDCPKQEGKVSLVKRM